MLLMAESQINSGSPPFLFPYSSAIFPTSAKNKPKFKIEVQLLDEGRRMFRGGWKPLGA